MRYWSIFLLLAALGGPLAGCNLFGIGPMTPSLALLQEGQGIKRLPTLTSDPRTEQVFWAVPFYWGHVGGHAVLGRVGQMPRRLDDQYLGLTGPGSASWSGDGQRVALTVKTGTRVPEAPNDSLAGNELDTVFVNDPSGATYRAIASEVTCGGIWLSPDGGKLLVRSVQGLTSPQYTVYDLASDAQKTIPLGNASTAFTAGPLWSPDGSKIAFLVQRSSLVIYDLNTDEETTVNSVADALIGWSPEGKTVYVGVTNNTRALTLMGYAPDGAASASTSIELPSSPTGTPFAPMLSPDGTKVAFVLQGLVSQGVYLADVQGGTARQVVPPSSLLGWLDASTLVCEVRKDGNLQVEYTVDLMQR